MVVAAAPSVEAPVGHATQALLPSELEYVPTPHEAHAVALEKLVKVPAGQTVQGGPPVALRYPAAHLHSDTSMLPAGEVLPLGQARQEELSASCL